MRTGMAVYNPELAESILRRGQRGLFAQDISLIYLLPKSMSPQWPVTAPDQFKLNLFLTLNVCYSITGGTTAVLDSLARKLQQHITRRGGLARAGLSDLETHIWRQLAVKKQNVDHWQRHFPETPWAQVWTRLQELADQKQNVLPPDAAKDKKTKTKAKKKTKKQMESDNRRLAQLTELVRLDHNLNADILTTLLPLSVPSGFRLDKPFSFPEPRWVNLADRPAYPGQIAQTFFSLQKPGPQFEAGRTEQAEPFYLTLAPNTTAASMLQVFAPPPMHIYQGRLLNLDQGGDQGRGDGPGGGLSQRQKYGFGRGYGPVLSEQEQPSRTFSGEGSRPQTLALPAGQLGRSSSNQSLGLEILTPADLVLWGGDAVQRKWRDHIQKRFALIEGRSRKSAALAQRERSVPKDGHPLAAALIPRMSLNLISPLPGSEGPGPGQEFRRESFFAPVAQTSWLSAFPFVFERLKRLVGFIFEPERKTDREHVSLRQDSVDRRAKIRGRKHGLVNFITEMLQEEASPDFQRRALSYKTQTGSQVSQAWPVVFRSQPDTTSPESAQDKPASVNPEPMSVNLDFISALLSLKATSVNPAKTPPGFRSSRGMLQAGRPGREFWAGPVFRDRPAIRPRRTLGVLGRGARSGRRSSGEALPELLTGAMDYGVMDYGARSASQAGGTWLAVTGSLPGSEFPVAAQHEPERLNRVNLDFVSPNYDSTSALANFQAASARPIASPPGFRSSRGALQVGRPGREFWARPAFRNRLAIRSRGTLGVLGRRSRFGKRSSGEESPALLTGAMDNGVMDYGARPAGKAGGTRSAVSGSLPKLEFPGTVQHELEQPNLVNLDFASQNHDSASVLADLKAASARPVASPLGFRSSRGTLQIDRPERAFPVRRAIRSRRTLGVLARTDRSVKRSSGEAPLGAMLGVTDSAPRPASQTGEIRSSVPRNLPESEFPYTTQPDLKPLNLDFASVNRHFAAAPLTHKTVPTVSATALPTGFRSSRGALPVERTEQTLLASQVIRPRRTLGVLRGTVLSNGEAWSKTLQGAMDSESRPASQAEETWPAVSGSLSGPKLSYVERNELMPAALKTEPLSPAVSRSTSRSGSSLSPAEPQIGVPKRWLRAMWRGEGTPPGPRTASQVGETWPAVSRSLPGSMFPFIPQNEPRRASLDSVPVNLVSAPAVLKTTPLGPAAFRSGSRLSPIELRAGGSRQMFGAMRRGESPIGEGPPYSILRETNPEPRIPNATSLGDSSLKLILRNSAPEPQTTVTPAFSSSLPTPKAAPDIIRTASSELKTKIKQLPTRAEVKNEEPQPDIENIVKQVYKRIEQQLRYERAKRGR